MSFNVLLLSRHRKGDSTANATLPSVSQSERSSRAIVTNSPAMARVNADGMVELLFGCRI
jgi:hypothetical protein